jgi:hypothetical protein
MPAFAIIFDATPPRQPDIFAITLSFDALFFAAFMLRAILPYAAFAFCCHFAYADAATPHYAPAIAAFADAAAAAAAATPFSPFSPSFSIIAAITPLFRQPLSRHCIFIFFAAFAPTPAPPFSPTPDYFRYASLLPCLIFR